jgi:hypothetical protein
MGVLNDYVKYLPTLKDSPTKAASEVQNKMILIGHQMLYCHAPVVKSFFIFWKILISPEICCYVHFCMYVTIIFQVPKKTSFCPKISLSMTQF